jgi:isorenieratene synthase
VSWVDADPAWIDAALAHATALPSGGWYVLDGRATFGGAAPRRFVVAGRELVVWRDAGGELRAAPNACPHMGASLAEGRVEAGRLVCPWHGLKLDARGFRDWQCAPVHDDGVLVWVRLGEGPTEAEGLTDRPILAPRPVRSITAVIRAEAACEPADILANRLDPWHGAYFHPYAFSALRVLEKRIDQITLRVTYRILGGIGLEVDATFHCPEPRTIVMTIIAGAGAGSVVETHATPIGNGRSAMIEATLATSEHAGFVVARRLAPFVRPFIARAARRLWVDDLAYAERRYLLRTS